MSARSQAVDSGPVRESGRITSLDLIRGVAVLGILLMNAVNFKLGSAPHFNLSAGGSETWLDWAVGIFGEIFIDQKFMGLFSLLFGAGMILFIDRASERGRPAVLAEPVAKRAAADNRRSPPPAVGWRRADGLRGVVGLSDRPAKAAELDAHLRRSYRVHAIRRVYAARAVHGRHDRRVAIGFLDARRDFDRRGHWGSLPAGLFPARIRADSRRRRPVSHRLYERRLAREDVSTDRNGRACRRPVPCRRWRRRHRGERLLARGRLYRPDPQYARHDSLPRWDT